MRWITHPAGKKVGVALGKWYFRARWPFVTRHCPIMN